jgi:hypothetical protein
MPNNLDRVSVYLIVFQYYYWMAKTLFSIFSNLSSTRQTPHQGGAIRYFKKDQTDNAPQCTKFVNGSFSKKDPFFIPNDIAMIALLTIKRVNSSVRGRIYPFMNIGSWTVYAHHSCLKFPLKTLTGRPTIRFQTNNKRWEVVRHCQVWIRNTVKILPISNPRRG